MSIRRTAGFTLLHMLVVMPLLGVFLLVATQVFNHAVALTKEARLKEERTAHFDHALRQLRRDVWGAIELTAGSPQRVEMTTAGGERITWTAPDAGEAMHRTVNDAAARRFGFPTTASFRVDGPTLVLVTDEGEAVLISQVLLAKEETR